MMQHKYPFTAFHIKIEANQLDVNVHPSKMELRFSDGQGIFDAVSKSITNALTHRELVPNIGLETVRTAPVASKVKPKAEVKVEPKAEVKAEVKVEPKAEVKAEPKAEVKIEVKPQLNEIPVIKPEPQKAPEPFETKRLEQYTPTKQPAYEQLQLFDEPKLLQEEHKKDIKIIGQVFDTYWIIQFENNMYIVDQHAAHEKVLFEEFSKRYDERKISTQLISPPEIIELTQREETILVENIEYFADYGFELEEFGDGAYAIRGIPTDFRNANTKELLLEILDSMTDDSFKKTPESIKDKIATMSCKAAVKGNNRISMREAEELLNKLMNLDNPYNCPHGRPTMIIMSKYELEKKFKRII